MTERSVVLGASIAGLLAAAALADAGWQVRVVERDRLPDSPSHRRGVPQGPHLHSLLSRGWQTMEALLPGLIDELIAAGAIVLDDDHLGSRMHIQNGPYAFNRTDPVSNPAALATYLVTRPLLEYQLRCRVAALPNASFDDGHDIVELVAAPRDRISGVTVAERRTGAVRTLPADLVVDATGRATRTPLLLEQLGYDPPPRKSFNVRGVYYSQQITFPDRDSFPERLVLVVPPAGGGRGGLVANEHGTWTLTVAAHDDEHLAPPTTIADMVVLAETFLPPHIHTAIRQAKPVSEIAVHRYPGGTWHRYDRCTRPPNGLLAIGDALCSLDPINGQGITMAALHAHALRAQLRSTGSVDPQHFHRSLTDVIAPVWAANQTVRTPPARGVVGRVRLRTLRWTRRMMLEAADDIVVTERLVRVVNMVDPPQRLMEPTFLARVFAHHLMRMPRVASRRRPGARASA